MHCRALAFYWSLGLGVLHSYHTGRPLARSAALGLPAGPCRDPRGAV